MSLLAVHTALLWRQRVVAARWSLPVRSPPFRWSSSSGSSSDMDDEVAKARKEAELAELRARQRIAEANAAAHEAKAKADAAAHEDKVKAEANKAKAEANKAKAEADDAGEKARASWDSNMRRRATLGTAVAGAIFLAYDHHEHHDKAVLRKRIKERFIAGPDEGLLPKPPDFPLLPLPPLPLQNLNGPLVVVGSSGSGKSTQLGELARDFKKKGVPVIYIRFRAARELDDDDARRGRAPPAPAEPDLTVAAQRFYKAVGYPERVSYWSRLRLDNLEWRGGLPYLSLSPAAVASRFRAAISDVFAVAAELTVEQMESERAAEVALEQKAGKGGEPKQDKVVLKEDRRPAVLADELHDLLHDRFGNAGGKSVFMHFGNEMIDSAVDADSSRTILAGSGSDLLKELTRLSTAKRSRVEIRSQPDPNERVVRERLKAMEYDQPSIDSIIAVCGTRVRYLRRFIRSKLEDVPSRVESIESAADDIVGDLMAQCPAGAERTQLVAVLDELAKSPSASVLVERLPTPLQNSFPNEALLWQMGRTATFQTEAVRRAWVRNRGKYV
jgi:hypothetical protein